MINYENKKILIVDDQKEFHILLKTMLTKYGVKDITVADNANDAMTYANNRLFDIYLIDYNLGAGKNGIQLLENLRSKNRIPVHALCFIITANCNKSMVLTAIEKAPDDYLIKPFSPTQLFNRFAKASHKKEILIHILKALQEKNYTQAIALCHEKIESGSKYSALCKNMLADIYITTNQYLEAEKILKELINTRAFMQTYINLGKTYYLQNKLTEAINILENVIVQSPLQIKAYEWLARAYKKNNELSKALCMLTTAADMTHNSIARYQDVILLAKKMNEYKIIINSFHDILQLSRNSFEAHPCHLANYIHSIIDYAKATTDLDEKKLILKKVNSTLYQSY